jgi:hypothetical protein
MVNHGTSHLIDELIFVRIWHIKKVDLHAIDHNLQWVLWYQVLFCENSLWIRSKISDTFHIIFYFTTTCFVAEATSSDKSRLYKIFSGSCRLCEYTGLRIKKCEKIPNILESIHLQRGIANNLKGYGILIIFYSLYDSIVSSILLEFYVRNFVYHTWINPLLRYDSFTYRSILNGRRCYQPSFWSLMLSKKIVF